MHLEEVEIRNFRSLEHVELTNLKRFNVFVGKNNAGKSSLISALHFLAHRVLRPDVVGSNILTDMDESRAVEFRIRLRLSDRERERCIALLAKSGLPDGIVNRYTKSALFRSLEYSFKSAPGSPALLQLHEVRTLAEDEAWAALITLPRTADMTVANPQRMFRKLPELARMSGNRLTAAAFNQADPPHSLISFQPHFAHDIKQIENNASELGCYPLTVIVRFLHQAFFFSPVRRSDPSQPARQTETLAQDGSNLAQLLHTVNSNNRRQFAGIENFMQEALPDVGALQTPLNVQNTSVSFISPNDFKVGLHDMGGGVEQLLMIAVVLMTTTDDGPLFIEEPESHLHPGAQRSLWEKLRSRNRQVFVTTHSPIFMNYCDSGAIYQLRTVNNRTSVTRIGDIESLSRTLDDIGARNSDVLLSDAVLFVEGPGDKVVLEILSKTVGTSLAGHNITVLTMQGGEYAHRYAPVRSELLEGISQKAPVPHLFVLDRDERTFEEIQGITTRLKDKIIFLARRELENYLLVPRAIREAIGAKRPGDEPFKIKVNGTTDSEIQEIIKSTAEGLKGLVLIKRIRAELKGMPGGIMDRDLTADLAEHAFAGDFPARLRAAIETKYQNQLSGLDLLSVVAAKRAELEEDWKDEATRLMIAPGEELVQAVYKHFGENYKKPKDTERIAENLRADEIHEELRQVVSRALGLGVGG